MTIKARMYGIAVLVSLASLTPVVASAQTTMVWSGGITGGATISTVDASTSNNLKSVWGATGGVFLGTNLNRNTGLQIEALVSQRGAQSGDAGNDAKLRLTYFDVPVVVRFGDTMTNSTHVHAFAGLTPGFRMSASVSSGAAKLSADISDNIKVFDLGFVFGVAVERGPWAVDGRYTFGLVNVDDAAGGPDLKNRSGAVKISYRIH